MEAASVMESQMLDTAHGQIHVLTCGPADGEAVAAVGRTRSLFHGPGEAPVRVRLNCYPGL